MKDQRSDAELNRIIAEWDGWTWERQHNKQYDPLSRYGTNASFNVEWDRSPSYCTDTIAIDRVVRRLDFNDQCTVCEEIVRRGNEELCYTTRSMAICFAEARVKAEALVKLIESK